MARSAGPISWGALTPVPKNPLQIKGDRWPRSSAPPAFPVFTLPDPEPIHHPATGEPIAQGPGEQLQRIAWPGAPVVVVTRPGPAGELVYRLARPSCQTWNPAAGLRFEPWPPS